VLWWSHGGKLHGQSPPRIAFLKKVLDDSPVQGIDPIDKWQDHHTAGVAGQYYLVYLGRQRPTEWLFELPRAGLSAGMSFTVEVLDTWNMTVTPVEGAFRIVADSTFRYHAEGLPSIALLGRPYMALRIRRAPGDQVKYREGERIYGE
jgi:hypothetical protein